jgi:chemotaxis protein CheD
MNNHYLFPSDIYVSKAPSIVTTVLGSCVSVCLWDYVRKIGGINHYLLPQWNGEDEAMPKYGDVAIEQLINKMLTHGCRKADMQAKVFGGSEQIVTSGVGYKIGYHNSQIASKLMKEYGIPVVGYSVNGNRGRRIQFLTHTGEVYLKFLGAPDSHIIRASEG